MAPSVLPDLFETNSRGHLEERYQVSFRCILLHPLLLIVNLQEMFRELSSLILLRNALRLA